MTDLQHAQQAIVLDRLDEEVNSLEGKAVTQAQTLAALELRVESIEARLRLRAQELFGPIEGKALSGMSREKTRTLRRVIEDIGGAPPDGGYAVDVLDFDDYHYERAMLLIRGEVPPESDAERKAVERWEAKHGPVG